MRVHVPLQARDAFADRRAGEVQALGCGRETAPLDHADKHIDAFEAFGRQHVIEEFQS
jgi:hypothetical protein